MNHINFSKYQTFGLRKEWIELFFAIRCDIFYDSSLGPKQKDALYDYLKDSELVESKKKTTIFFDLLFNVYTKEGINSGLFWSIFWNNLACNSSLFSWWNQNPIGLYKREEIITSLANTYGKMNRTIRNAYTSLVGTLESTPFGSELRQGIVQKVGNQRVVHKLGHPELSPFALLYALAKRAERRREFECDLIALSADALSPQTIFALDAAEVERGLRALWLPHLFQLRREDDGAVRVALTPGLTAQDVATAYLERL